jgi:formate transporter
VNEPPPPIFNLNAYNPAEIQEAIETVGVKKAAMPIVPCFALAVVAGGSIGFGALYYSIVASDADLSFATVRVLGGVVFSLGMAIVLIAGAELFTGNNLIVMAWASGKVSTMAVLRNWAIVYVGNFVGAVGLVVLVYLSHHLDMNSGRIGLTVLNTAVAKISPGVTTLFVKGILCNMGSLKKWTYIPTYFAFGLVMTNVKVSARARCGPANRLQGAIQCRRSGRRAAASRLRLMAAAVR